MKRIFCEISKCVGCKNCELSCAVEHSKNKTLSLSITEKLPPMKRRRVQMVDDLIISDACHHCEKAPCIAACMSAAMYKDKDGSTQHDREKCVGCWMCVMVCPFGAIKRQEKQALKCDLCKDRKEGPACVPSCKTKALVIKEE